MTSTLGSNVTGTNGQLQSTIPAGYYSGAQTAMMSDTNLIAANIKLNEVIFGVTGSLVERYGNCTDNALNAGQCSTAANRYVYDAAYGGRAANGADITTGWTNVSATTTVTRGIPDGFYSGKSVSFTDLALLPQNIKDGISNFGVTGNYVEVFAKTTASNMHRDPTTTQITLHAESSASETNYTNTDPGYRAIPKISKDDDGYHSSSPVVKVNRSASAHGGAWVFYGNSGVVESYYRDSNIAVRCVGR